MDVQTCTVLVLKGLRCCGYLGLIYAKYKASGAFGDGEWTYEGDIDPQSIKNFFYGAAFAG